jgi:hypothetical protein
MPDDREVIEFLAIRVMGWSREFTSDCWRDGSRRRTARYDWNPLESEADAAKLVRAVPVEKREEFGDLLCREIECWFDPRKRILHATTFEIVTATPWQKTMAVYTVMGGKCRT